jgi:hypothetical protein
MFHHTYSKQIVEIRMLVLVLLSFAMITAIAFFFSFTRIGLAVSGLGLLAGGERIFRLFNQAPSFLWRVVALSFAVLAFGGFSLVIFLIR